MRHGSNVDVAAGARRTGQTGSVSDDVVDTAGGFDRRAEVEALWQADDTWVGEVYRQIKDGMTVKEIADASSITLGPVYGSVNLFNALIEGTVSPFPTVAQGWAGRIRSWLRKKDLSAELRAALQEQEKALSAVAEAATPSTSSADSALRGASDPRMWGVHNDALSAGELIAGGFVSIGWDQLGDLSQIGPDRGVLKDALEAALPGEKPGAYPNWAGQLRRFAFEMQSGDIVVAPDKQERTLNFGRVVGPYEYNEDVPSHRNRVPVEWLATGIPRDDFSAAARHEISSAMTVFEVKSHTREFAEAIRRSSIAAITREFADLRIGDRVRQAAGDGGSLFTPGAAIWTLENADELGSHYVDAPDLSASSFDEKLDNQMNGVSDGALQLFAELWYINLLPLADYTPETKRKLLTRFLARMTRPVVVPDDLDKALGTAAFSGGVAAKTRRWAQLALLIRFAEALLRLDTDARTAAQADPQAFSEFLAGITEPNEPAQRRALKFVMFPDYFLPIVSDAHRKAIVTAFTAKLGNSIVGRDTDETLHLITEALRAQDGEDPELYVPPYLDVWDPARILVKTGDKPTPEAARAWFIRPAGASTLRRWVADDHVALDAKHLGEVTSETSRSDLAAAVNDGYGHLPEAERAERSDDFAAFLTKMNADDVVVAVAGGAVQIGKIEGTAQYVVPDDGTPELRRAATWTTRVPLDAVPREVAARLTSEHDVLDLTSFVSVLEALDEKATALPDQLTLPDATAELAVRLHVTEGWVQEVVDLLRDRPQLIFYGPPGTGKTYLARKIAEHLTGDPSRVKLVQFHPAYSYEDFFEGYRPTDTGTFTLKRGPMRRIVDQARDHPGTPYVLIIDEINRGNLAKVFGELYFLLEYREETVDLMYGGDDKGFTLPENVFIIGTMNTADRSIALVDAAMRRRFAFLPLHPDEEPTSGILRRWLGSEGHGSQTADLLDALNERIDDPDFKIGPSYFMRPAVHAPGGLERTWRTAILPALEEHHFGDGTDVVARYGLAAIRRAITPPETPPADVATDVEGLNDVTEE